MIDVRGLHAELTAAGLPVTGANLTTAAGMGAHTFHTRPDGTVRLDWAVAPSVPQVSSATALVLAHDATASALQQLRTLVKDLFDVDTAAAKNDRAIVDMARVSDNTTRKWLVDFKAAVAGAATLAALKVAVALLPDLPPLSKADARDAFRLRVDEDVPP